MNDDDCAATHAGRDHTCTCIGGHTPTDTDHLCPTCLRRWWTATGETA